MNRSLLLKGFEVELFTGSFSGEHVGVASVVTREIPSFVKEPDNRNIEYITAPESKYLDLKEALLAPRRQLRNWLNQRNLTLLPGSTLSLGDSRRFERSDPSNPYHELIESTYGTKIVTASIHINLGIEDLSFLFAALRLVRCEAALLLSLSASSPFLDGLPTGAHSQRWLQFPRTPPQVPIFLKHSHYVSWVEEQLANGIMSNERHLWTSVRPNGLRRPYDLNRLELRICDLITDCDLLLAVTSLLELRVLSLLEHPIQLDPLHASRLSVQELSILSDMNDIKAAEMSLDATLHHWRDGQPILSREWIMQLIEEVKPLAISMDMFHQLAPLQLVLDQGNQAIQWVHEYQECKSVQSVLQKSIVQMSEEENKSEVMFG